MCQQWIKTSSRFRSIIIVENAKVQAARPTLQSRISRNCNTEGRGRLREIAFSNVCSRRSKLQAHHSITEEDALFDNHFLFTICNKVRILHRFQDYYNLFTYVNTCEDVTLNSSSSGQ